MATIDLRGSQVRKYQNTGCVCGVLLWQPNARLWLPGMGEDESIAVRIIEGYGEVIGFSQEVTPNLGLRFFTYFSAGVLDGALVLMNKNSVRKFLQETGLQETGDEKEVLTRWQRLLYQIRDEAIRQGQPELTPRQENEILNIYLQSLQVRSSLEEVTQWYLTTLEVANTRGFDYDFKEHLFFVLYIAREINRPIEQIAAGYFEYLKVSERTRPMKRWELNLHDWATIFSLSKHFPNKDFQLVVRYFFAVVSFGQKWGVTVWILWQEGSVFLHDALAFDLSVEYVIQKYEEALRLKRDLKVQKRSRDGLSTNDLAKILITIEREKIHWERMCFSDKGTKSSIHIPSNEFLPRSLIYYPKGSRIFILFSKQGKHRKHCSGEDAIVGEGSDVVVKEAFEISSKTLCVITVQPQGFRADTEMILYQELYPQRVSLTGLTKVYGRTCWRSKNGEHITKVGIIMPRYQSDLLKEMRSLQNASWETRKKLAIEFAQGLAALHKIDWIHRDLKPDNLFLDAKGHIYIGDLRRAERASVVRAPIGGSPLYQPPEYSLHYFEFQKLRRDPKSSRVDLQSAEEKCICTTTLALDIWAVGLIFWELFKKEIDDPGIFLDETVSGVPYLMTWKIFEENEYWKSDFSQAKYWLPSSKIGKGTIAEIVWRCLFPDPRDRPTAEELLGAVKTMTAV